MADGYQYKKKEVAKDPNKEFRLGEGRISGIASIVLGVLSLLAVLAYLYPSYLTTTELREVYDGERLQKVLNTGCIFPYFSESLPFC